MKLTLQDTDPMPLGPLVKYVAPAPLVTLPVASPWVEARETMPSDERARPMTHYYGPCSLDDPLGQHIHTLKPGEAVPDGAEGFRITEPRPKTIKFRRWVPPSARPVAVGVDLAAKPDATVSGNVGFDFAGNLAVLDMMQPFALRDLQDKARELAKRAGRYPIHFHCNAPPPKPPMFEKGERVRLRDGRLGRVEATVPHGVDVRLDSGELYLAIETDLDALIPF